MICPKCHFEWEEDEYISEDERRLEKKYEEMRKSNPKSMTGTGNGGMC